MTIISDYTENIAGASDNSEIVFYTKQLRDNEDSNAIVTTKKYRCYPTDGQIITEDLDPGPAEVKIGLDKYSIWIPDSSTPVRLGPLIQVGMAPLQPHTGLVFNAGGVDRVQAKSTTEYAELTKDPATVYFLFQEGA